VFALSASASGQQPKRKEPPPPFALLPAEQAWLTTLDAPPSAGGAMDAVRVYLPLASDQTVAVDRETGKVAWTRDIESAWPPLVSGDVILIAASDELHAVDPASGAERWRAPLEQAFATPPQMVGNLIVGTTEQGTAVALHPADGRVAWQQALGAKATHAVAGGEGQLYVALEKGRIVALAAASGALLWERTVSGALSQPSVAADRVLVGTDTNDLYALDADSGAIEWKWRVGGDVIGTGADSEGRLYFASLDNLLRAVNRGNGNQRWRKEITTRPAQPPRVLHDIVLLTGVAPVITSYATRTGAIVGSFTAPAELQGPPLVDADLKAFRVALVLITRDGRVLGLRPTAMLFQERPIVPFQALPGTRLPREPRPAS
jgi:outer membrane protein assembly factor BamB